MHPPPHASQARTDSPSPPGTRPSGRYRAMIVPMTPRWTRLRPTSSLGIGLRPPSRSAALGPLVRRTLLAPAYLDQISVRRSLVSVVTSNRPHAGRGRRPASADTYNATNVAGRSGRREQLAGRRGGPSLCSHSSANDCGRAESGLGARRRRVDKGTVVATHRTGRTGVINRRARRGALTPQGRAAGSTSTAYVVRHQRSLLPRVRSPLRFALARTRSRPGPRRQPRAQ